jgi:hypothetical protein
MIPDATNLHDLMKSGAKRRYYEPVGDCSDGFPEETTWRKVLGADRAVAAGRPIGGQRLKR